MSALGSVPVISFETPGVMQGGDEPPDDLWTAVTVIKIPVVKKKYKDGSARYSVKMKTFQGNGGTRELAVADLRSKLRRACECLHNPKTEEVSV